MSLFDVDQQKCTRCGICSEVCPAGIIQLKEEEAFPTPDTMKICINCGHCAAVCPHEALSLESMPIDQLPGVQEDLIPGAEQVEHYLRARRSIRSYQDKPVEREILAKVIDIARFAPTSQNLQPVNWIVVYEKDEVKRMTEMVINFLRYLIKKEPAKTQDNLFLRLVADYESGTDSICHGAPHIIAAHARKENLSALVDCTIAMTYLDLVLPSFGLGSCWAGYFDLAARAWPPLQNALGFPVNHTSLGAMLVGYPKYKYYRLPLRNNPAVTWITSNDDAGNYQNP